MYRDIFYLQSKITSDYANNFFIHVHDITIRLVIIISIELIMDSKEDFMAIASAVHILVKTEKQALELKKQLDKGADFAMLAKKHSICPSKKKGGDLGEFKRGQMVKAFDDVVFKKPILTLHGPVKTKFGFHLIKTIYRS